MIRRRILRPTAERARELESAVLRSGILRRTNYTGLSAKDRYYIGYVGELVFREWLEEEGRVFAYEPRTDGRSDDGDFIIRGVDRWAKVDVKTLGNPRRQTLLISPKQLVHSTSTHFVATRINGEHCELWGWALRAEVLAAPLVRDHKDRDSHSIPLTELHPLGGW